MGCGIIFPRNFTFAQSSSGHNRKSGDGRDSYDDSLDDNQQRNSSSEDLPSLSDVSSHDSDSDESPYSDGSDGLYKGIGAQAWAPMPDYRLLAIGRGFPVQFMQERRVRRLQRRADDHNGPKVEVFFTRNGKRSRHCRDL